MTRLNATPGPFHETKIARCLRDHRADHPEITDDEIARHLGYDRSEIIAMFRNGFTKLPLDKAASLAQILKVDPIAVTRLALDQFGLLDPGTNGHIFDRMSTINEQVLVDAYRKSVDGSDYALARKTIDAIATLIAEAYGQSARSSRALTETT